MKVKKSASYILCTVIFILNHLSTVINRTSVHLFVCNRVNILNSAAQFLKLLPLHVVCLTCDLKRDSLEPLTVCLSACCWVTSHGVSVAQRSEVIQSFRFLPVNLHSGFTSLLHPTLHLQDRLSVIILILLATRAMREPAQLFFHYPIILSLTSV